MLRNAGRRYIAAGSFMSGPSSLNEQIVVPETRETHHQYKQGPRRKFIVRKPKPVKVELLEMSEKSSEELEQIIPFEEPVDTLKIEAEELIERSIVNIDLPKEEMHPSKPNRRLFRKYENFEIEHFPAASQSDYTPEKMYDTYRDNTLAKGEIQVTIPRPSSVTFYKSKRVSTSTHHNVALHSTNTKSIVPLMFSQSPLSYLGSSYWAKHNRDRFKWETDPLATSWDMLLDEPTNPLLSAPITSWVPLPLDGETLPPNEIRDESVPRTVQVDGQEFTVSPNDEVDILPVSVTPKPGHWFKQYGMPMDKAIGPIQWDKETVPAMKLIRSVKQGSLTKDPKKPGQDMRILCVGDSLTLGITKGSDKTYYSKGEKTSLNMEDEDLDPREHPYALRLHHLLNADIDILGVPRDTTDLMRDRMLLKVKEQFEKGMPYDLVIIWGGIWDLYDPNMTGHEVALNLTRMHHVCHLYGAKTLGLTLPQLPNKPHGKYMNGRVIDTNEQLQDFAKGKRRDMSIVDIHRLIPYSVHTFNIALAADQPLIAKRNSAINPIWHSAAIEMTPLGYDRVGELIFKQLKHMPGFLQKAIPDRFYSHPCNEPHNKNIHDQIKNAVSLRRTRSRVKSQANATPYGCTYHNKMYFFFFFFFVVFKKSIFPTRIMFHREKKKKKKQITLDRRKAPRVR